MMMVMMIMMILMIVLMTDLSTLGIEHIMERLLPTLITKVYYLCCFRLIVINIEVISTNNAYLEWRIDH
jgi:hypothetical protein